MGVCVLREGEQSREGANHSLLPQEGGDELQKQISRNMEAESSLPALGSWLMPDWGTGLFSAIAGERGKLGNGREQKQTKKLKGSLTVCWFPLRLGGGDTNKQRVTCSLLVKGRSSSSVQGRPAFHFLSLCKDWVQLQKLCPQLSLHLATLS